ncbi:hypothetical protein BS78_01G448400 [Paspalum vaginatum]|nr:hypothetical protein BS78_01G448400 [Paspalum vaginatum]
MIKPCGCKVKKMQVHRRCILCICSAKIAGLQKLARVSAACPSAVDPSERGLVSPALSTVMDRDADVGDAEPIMKRVFDQLGQGERPPTPPPTYTVTWIQHLRCSVG